MNGDRKAWRRIVRILCRASACAVLVAAVVPNRASAQTGVSQLAYRAEYAYWSGSACFNPGPLQEDTCEFLEGSYLATPWASVDIGDEPTWSPDATKIAFTDGSNIYVISPFGGNAVQLTNVGSNEAADEPAWSPDGTRIAFVRHTATSREIDIMSPDGSGVLRLTDG